MDGSLFPNARPPSPLLLADHLLTLAQDVERAGYPAAAAHLVALVYDVLDPEAKA